MFAADHLDNDLAAAAVAAAAAAAADMIDEITTHKSITAISWRTAVFTVHLLATGTLNVFEVPTFHLADGYRCIV